MKHSHVPLLIFAVAVMCVVSALYAYMYHATLVSINRASLARDIVATEQNDQTQAKDLAKIASDTVLERSQVPHFFIPADDVVSFITTLEALGPQSGATVTLSSIDSDVINGAAPGTIGHARAHVDASGSWLSIMRLISLSENMPYAVSISHLNLNNGGAQDTKDAKVPQHIWSASFDVQAAVLVPSDTSTQ
ncbi:MAG TPA: hypothetical protein VL335_03275 [Candidatus Paceibacterota bacterium]|nr:hypothetical protein [Candidatus Paceibacterota bacterium]